MDTHQCHDAQPVHLPGRAVGDAAGRGAAAAGRGGAGQGPGVGDGAQRAEPPGRLQAARSLQAAAAHAALDFLRALLRVLLLLLDQPEWGGKKRLRGTWCSNKGKGFLGFSSSLPRSG